MLIWKNQFTSRYCYCGKAWDGWPYLAGRIGYNIHN